MDPETVMNVIDIVSKVIAGAAVIATITPSPKDNMVLGVLKKLLDVLAANVGKAKNAE